MRRHARVLFVIAALASFFAFASVASAEFESTGSFSGPGSGDGQIDLPGRAALERSTGNLFVADSNNNRVQVFKPNGSGTADYLTQFGSGLSKPWGIAIDEVGGQTYVYVADAGNDRIVKYASNEAGTPSFSVDGSFTSPAKGSGAGQVGDFKAALAIDPGTHDLLVADYANQRIARFNSDGSADGSFDGANGSSAFSGPIDVAVNSGGDIYVIDADASYLADRQGSSKALRYSPAGVFKAELSPVGTENDGQQRPATVAVNPANDEVAVSGGQGATYADQPPTLHAFNSSNAALGSSTLPSAYNTFTGLVFGTGAKANLYAVLDWGVYQGTPYPAGSPKIEHFVEVKKPVLSLDPVAESAITRTEAQFIGTVNPNGFATEWHFEYSSDGGGSWTSTPDQSAGSGTSPVAVSASVSGLEVQTGYQVRLVASSSEGSATSDSQSFTTDGAVSAVVTEPATAITEVSATLNGSITPGGVALTECKFEYGSTEALGQVVPCAESTGSIGSGEAPVPVHADLSGLSAGFYYARLVASNSFGTNFGEQRTVAIPGLPVILSQRADVSGARVYLKATINPGYQSATYRFEYGPTASYGSSTDEEGLAGNTDVAKVVQTPGDLPPGTYHYRVIVQNSLAEIEGADQTFTIDPADTATCPNARFRAEQSSGYLPECRAYELVSPANKMGGAVFNDPAGFSFSAVNPDGTGVTFESQSAFADPQAAYTLNPYVARRGTDGWTSQSISSSKYPLQGIVPIAWSSDLSRAAIFASDGPLGSGRTLAPGGTPSAGNLYLHDFAAGTYTTATLDPGPGNYPGNTTLLKYAGGTSDLSTVVFEDVIPHTGDTPFIPGGDQRFSYAWHHGQLSLVGILPDPDGPGGLEGESAPSAVIGAGPEKSRSNAISADGSRIFFTTPDGRLYVREDGTSTLEVAASQKASPDAQQPATFWTASTHGRFVFFSTEEQLLDSDGNQASDLYRYDVETDALIRLTADEGLLTMAGAATDGSYAYYTGMDGNLRVWHAGQSEVIAESGTQAGLADDFPTVRVTPDGTAIAFLSSGESPSEEEQVLGQQVYLYNAVTDTLRCASCRRDGKEATGPATMRGGKKDAIFSYEAVVIKLSSLSEDGRRVFFDTPDPLVNADSNEQIDVYEYFEGKQRLISSGLSPFESQFMNATPDGGTVFFTTLDQLVRRDGDNSIDMYAARTNGGFLEAPGPDPCAGEACKAGSTAPPQERSAASAQFSGPGNATPRAHKKAKKHKKKQKGRKGKHKKKRSSKSKSASKRSVGK